MNLFLQISLQFYNCSHVFAGKIAVGSDGEIHLYVPTNTLITLSTVSTAMKGSHQTPPASAPFPLPYSDTFGSNGFSEAYNFADQSGKFETYLNTSETGDHKWTLRQVCICCKLWTG